MVILDPIGSDIEPVGLNIVNRIEKIQVTSKSWLLNKSFRVRLRRK